MRSRPSLALFRAGLLLAIFGLSGSASATEVRNFFAPEMDGARVDACLGSGGCGKPAADAHLGNPEFMVQYALNLSDVANWQEVEVALKDGSTTTARKYVSPVAEQTHLQALRKAATRESKPPRGSMSCF